jgi:hypothetical protein
MGDVECFRSRHRDFRSNSNAFPVSARERHSHPSVGHSHLEVRIHRVLSAGIRGTGRLLSHDLAALTFLDNEGEPFAGRERLFGCEYVKRTHAVAIGNRWVLRRIATVSGAGARNDLEQQKSRGVEEVAGK